MRKQPFFASTAILALAVGIGVASTGFSVLEATLFAELPFENADRFVRLSAHTEPGGQSFALDGEAFRLFEEQAETLEHLGALGVEPVTIGEKSDLEPLFANLISPSSFVFTGAQPLTGRLLLALDALPGSEPVVLVRESLWHRRWSHPQGQLGKSRETDPLEVATPEADTLRIDGVDHTVIGVMPNDFEFPSTAEIWLPVGDGLTPPHGGQTTGTDLFAILDAEASIQDAAAELNHLAAALTVQSADPVHVSVKPYTAPPEGFGLAMTVMVTVMVLVLIVIACNVANLIFARTEARGRELAVRTALGAPRRRLIGQLFVEVAAMGIVAAFLGLSVSRAVLVQLETALDELPFWIDLTPGPRTVLFAAGLTFLASAIGGVLPALRATRRDPAEALAGSSASSGARFGFGRLGNFAIVGQMALSVALLSTALVFARGFVINSTPSENLPRGTILTAQLTGLGDYDPQDLMDEVVASMALEDKALVESYGVGTHLPRIDPPLRRFLLEKENGDESSASLESHAAPVAWVSRDFFMTLGGRALSGRLFRQQDWQAGAAQVAVVNELFVERFFGGRNPVGRRLEMQSLEVDPENLRTDRSYEIVGVVPDLGLSETDPDSAAGFYLPLEESPFYFLALRTSVNPMELEVPLRAALASLDPKIQLRRVTPLENVGSEDRAMLTGMGSAMTALGLVALLLSMVGIYAMMSFAVTRRTREIGIRSALGASRRQILLTILGGASVHLLLGGVLGAALGSLVLRGKANLVTRLPTAEPWILPSVLVFLFVAGMVACYVPARRALRVRPSEALRNG